MRTDGEACSLCLSAFVISVHLTLRISVFEHKIGPVIPIAVPVLAQMQLIILVERSGVTDRYKVRVRINHYEGRWECCVVAIIAQLLGIVTNLLIILYVFVMLLLGIGFRFRSNIQDASPRGGQHFRDNLLKRLEGFADISARIKIILSADQYHPVRRLVFGEKPVNIVGNVFGRPPNHANISRVGKVSVGRLPVFNIAIAHKKCLVRLFSSTVATVSRFSTASLLTAVPPW
mmetsp:Transcript_29282/g.29726  ORF Transcript_29282/g.29726 Transcript_29282/m.29726 type:complete len:232 (-) Transcript_29282:128-823(-)